MSLLPALILFGALTGGSQATVAPRFPPDFDFLFGEWSVTNRRRDAWLANSDDWTEFSSTCRIWPMLDGMVVLDECATVRNGRTSLGSGYRIYNPASETWTIFWASTDYPELGLMRQVSGRMNDGEGEFFGEEDFQGQKVRLRFRWHRVSDSEARWEQAYFDTERDEWETNWTMRFVRRGSSTAC